MLLLDAIRTSVNTSRKLMITKKKQATKEQKPSQRKLQETQAYYETLLLCTVAIVGLASRLFLPLLLRGNGPYLLKQK